MSTIFAFALGCGTKNRDDNWLEVFYPDPYLNPDPKLIEVVREEVGYQGGNAALELTHRQVQHLAREWREAGFEHEASYAVAFQESERPVVLTILETDAEPASTPEAYLKLHLLSHRLVKPHGVVLSGIFPLLPNVAWTNEGAVDLEELPERQLLARLNGKLLEVNSVDKFPKMTDYVIPTGVRIADTARVRLGAYVGEGTTIMHEGFINFNAGTEGPGMIEGRISAGVFVGKGSDIGGGASTMGTLSGGGNIVISLGEGCLLGANAGTGIPLGDRCTIEAGLYITSGTKVEVLDENGGVVDTVKARDLAGKSDLLFRRNSESGAVQCRTNKSAIALNEELHKHN
ncbi:2,3,4,5-tetrahydropyridine-2-carboxylate N-succinyltransferase DapD [Alloalcanivorax dieselolei B5]|uniref:2,3,4,5-tetrahydropyridine-2,6-dicarboxylate N-succinyltransferase n=1 Tax=Alcanivorax dieselolei (strain DSM 16502 / CGMCC 1.3690 / MCCC 1A00001 / B-5) TaxID=930169 RepID=K0CF22_ALCDB|nr:MULTISPECIES: 2,3,4,5-tetrahydropyridine-2,6-dicarboxylate N-succinyltransferase [Alcanivoracaceae]AFT70191.1 2,3,4,5-tetrahydropyridine-2-carboxylate N-succinyltransferase DapD [Alloalcanivorax dieselolei B5]GGJ95731.1 2,3,4,5-tetrahydropyridine-2,6-dicarboxylate N-succinyltransferase [Alloalcanivorax dieselolei]